MLARKLTNQKGFTLLEMLVVIMIMGFLLAMIAPRFAGIFGDSEDTICDTNIKTTRQYLAGFEMSNNKLPNDLVNIVTHTGDTTTTSVGTYTGPCEEDPLNDGTETFTSAILERICLTKHALSADEAAELGGFGINWVLNYNNPDDFNDTDEGITTRADIYGDTTPDISVANTYMDKVPLAEGVCVNMIGGGNGGTVSTAKIDEDVWFQPYVPGFAFGTGGNADYSIDEDFEAGDFRWFNRIVLGVGPDCELVTSEYCQAAGICPSYERGASQSSAWGYYCMVLPRLESTLDQINQTTAMPIIVKASDGANEGDQAQEISVDVYAAAERSSDFDVFCPEGHLWPELTEMWIVQ